jgi:hypothetical protein
VQVARNNLEAARRTLASLRLPYVAGEVRARAKDMLRQIGPPADAHPSSD